MRKMLFYLYVKQYVNTLAYQGLLSIISKLKTLQDTCSKLNNNGWWPCNQTHISKVSNKSDLFSAFLQTAKIMSKFFKSIHLKKAIKLLFGYLLISLKENIRKILSLLVKSTTVLRLRFSLEHRKLNFTTGLFGDLTQTTFFLSTLSYPEHKNKILTTLKWKVLCER